jgi:hypothetical protein
VAAVEHHHKPRVRVVNKMRLVEVEVKERLILAERAVYDFHLPLL